MEMFEIGKTYLIFPFYELKWLNTKWVIGKVTGIEIMLDGGCCLTLKVINKSNSFKVWSAVSEHRIFVPRITLGSNDREIKDKTDLLFAAIDMEEIEDDSNEYAYSTSTCPTGFI